jgi:hypothetical protein
VSISEFLGAPVKGSKRFRKFFEKARVQDTNILEQRSVTTFFNLINLPVPPVETLTKCITLWTTSCFSNGLREFSFKCWNNYLALNNRVAAYDNTVSPLCTFCRIRDPDTGTRESFVHLFFSCPSVHVLITRLLEYFLVGNLSREELSDFFWLGIVHRQEKTQFFFVVFWETFRYFIYRYKSHRKIPNEIMLKNDIFFSIKSSLMHSAGYRALIESDPALARWLQALG